MIFDIKTCINDSGTYVINGDCLDILRDLPDNSVDAVVTDPPYGLSNTDPAHVADTLVRWVNGERDYLPPIKGGFMGKAWDSFVPPVAVWDECYRVLKPGGHVLVFAGSRTHDLMTLGIRLAGFDVRDSIAWLYGTGFPKSMDVSKAIDATLTTGGSAPKNLRKRDMGDAYAPSPLAGTPGYGDGSIATAAGGGNGRERGDAAPLATPDAERWQGWGTALKPAHEPIVVARKPLAGTVAANVIAHGTGALNIDACRVGDEVLPEQRAGDARIGTFGRRDMVTPERTGRWPANVILDESQAAELDRQSGITRSNVRKPTGKDDRGVPNTDSQMVMRRNDTTTRGVSDSGGASRFFYIAKDDKWDATSTKTTTTRTSATNATKSRGGTGSSAPAVDASGGTDPRFFYIAKAKASERPKVGGIAHPTVKPLTLIRYLVRLVTPPGGIVLDPFAGSGTTMEAARMEGFDVIGIEREKEYIPLIAARVERTPRVSSIADVTDPTK